MACIPPVSGISSQKAQRQRRLPANPHSCKNTCKLCATKFGTVAGRDWFGAAATLCADLITELRPDLLWDNEGAEMVQQFIADMLKLAQPQVSTVLLTMWIISSWTRVAECELKKADRRPYYKMVFTTSFHAANSWRVFQSDPGFAYDWVEPMEWFSASTWFADFQVSAEHTNRYTSLFKGYMELIYNEVFPDSKADFLDLISTPVDKLNDNLECRLRENIRQAYSSRGIDPDKRLNDLQALIHKAPSDSSLPTWKDSVIQLSIVVDKYHNADSEAQTFNDKSQRQRRIIIGFSTTGIPPVMNLLNKYAPRGLVTPIQSHENNPIEYYAFPPKLALQILMEWSDMCGDIINDSVPKEAAHTVTNANATTPHGPSPNGRRPSSWLELEQERRLPPRRRSPFPGQPIPPPCSPSIGDPSS
ncbi:uncharacterized protein B0H18DRAFT_999537 [Fomitopsis serialis]|uniref:uncharacterized protein n=1 Tax=Fomitopsis serialis TaxID=139415 RepID=UPI002007544D|nr:uncharacterized protein B0H18DRAFT_999537 [Neoantrodia serialis]KAH9928949.1 hypothetical protein B0H18DRAFT_999537 [Neoantrodia serialis]